MTCVLPRNEFLLIAMVIAIISRAVFLGTLVVSFRLAGDVAGIALYAERGRDELHCGHQLVGGDVLEFGDVLKNLSGGFYFGLRLQAEGQCDCYDDELLHFSTFPAHSMLARYGFAGLA